MYDTYMLLFDAFVMDVVDMVFTYNLLSWFYLPVPGWVLMS